jgi:hypothetical protein
MFSGPAEAGWARRGFQRELKFGAAGESSSGTGLLTRRTTGAIGKCLQNEPEGCGLAPALSVQKWLSCSRLPLCARTRWVTERIAPPPRVVEYDPESIRRNDRLECRLAKRKLGSSGSAQENLTFGNGNFFYLLTPALMGDTRPNG